MGKIISFISVENGAGKTTSCAALASCLAVLGHNVLCISYELETNDLEQNLGIDYPGTGIFEHPEIPELSYLNLKVKYNPNELSSDHVAQFFDSVRAEYDFCLIDKQPGEQPKDTDSFFITPVKPDILMVITSKITLSSNELNQIIDPAYIQGIKNICFMINRITPDDFVSKWTKLDKLFEKTNAELIGAVLEDPIIQEALNEKTLLIRKKEKLALYDFMDTARRLAAEPVKWPFLRKHPRINSVVIKGVKK